ncbi:MAG: NAD/NADP octopine/nopaline dehydrogenase family protein [Rhodospirillales bacterium]|jgi:opine dehydrogenase|nr:NAD/NADP octopine/nopaline dehydrogenase family protein [Rhodospirillales bacterium]HJO72438.1 NAD/NADP octopine/nopaline dehydrogenase family protein [Rhodospirillales bacterium]
MSVVAILGGGAGGLAAAAELSGNGHAIRLWNRSPETIEAIRAEGAIVYEGVLGNGRVTPERISTDLQDVIAGADVIVVCLPTLAHAAVAGALAEADATGVPIVLNPGQTGGALEVHNAFVEAHLAPPPIAEFSTLTYVARKPEPSAVTVTGAAGRVWVAGMPGAGAAVKAAQALFPAAVSGADVLATSLANANLVLHPPGAVLGASWVEATGGGFTFYVEGMTPGVARVMTALDGERLAVAGAFGHELPPIVEEMAAIGTVEAADAEAGDLVHAVSGGAANAKIKAPHSFDHRYYMEDFGHGLVPFLALARAAGVETPVASALLRLGATLTGRDFYATGRTAARMGIAGLDRDALLRHVRGKS